MTTLTYPRSAPQVVASTNSHLESVAFATGTRRIGIVCNVDTYIDLGTAPVATSSKIYCIALVPYIFGVVAGEKLSALRVGGADGVVSITESKTY